MIPRGAFLGLVPLLAVVASPLIAANVAIRTGEHPGFTRIVVDDPKIQGWQVGRSPDGYILRLMPEGFGFDLANAFRSIGRDRLASIRVDDAGQLHLGLACNCHVMPREIRPGVIVIDIQDGSAPVGSIFENSLPAAGAPPIAGLRPRPRPVAESKPYDWRAVETPTKQLEPVIQEPALEAMRMSLIEQLSRGAASGAVDFVAPPTVDESPIDALPPQMQILPTPGFDPASADRLPETLTAAGSDCVSDDRLAIATWGNDQPVAQQMAAALAGLSGEFDEPRPEDLGIAIRFYLYLGFGAEARQLMHAFQASDPDRELWDSLAQVLDGKRNPEGPLAGMAGCDTAASLWSVLAQPPVSGRLLNSPAVLRSFSALPVHLRRHLGPRLAEDFLTFGDAASARSVRDAMMRAPGDAGVAAHLADARLDLAEDAGTSLEDLSNISRRTGPTGAEALALLTLERIGRGEVPPGADLTTMAALLAENQGTEVGARLGHAYRLALAATGDFETAFRRSDLAPTIEPEIWKILAERGADSAILAHAVMGADKPRPELPDATRQMLAERLLALSLSGPADFWLRDGPKLPAEAARLEVRVLPTQGADAVAPDIRSPVVQEDPASRPSASSSGATEDVTQTPETDLLTGAGSSPQSKGDGDSGPLARSRALISESSAARARIEALLRNPDR